jgi:hypothetical protein
MIDALVQKIQLDEHGKFRCYVMCATMDMPIWLITFRNSVTLKTEDSNMDWVTLNKEKHVCTYFRPTIVS